MSGDERFRIVFLNGLDGNYSIQDTIQEIPSFYNDIGFPGTVEPLVELMNNLHGNSTKIINLLECRLDKSTKELNEWENLRNNPRKEKQVLIRETEIMLLTELLKQIKQEGFLV